VLKTLGIIAAIGALMPAVRHRALHVVGGRDVTDLPALPPPVPARVSTRAIDAKTAVAAFLRDMIEYGGGCEFQTRHILASYDQMRVAKQWPELTIKALSCELVALGCERGQIDLRKAGGGRPSTLVLPDRVKRRRA